MPDLSPPEHETSESVMEAARWYAVEKSPPRPIVPALRARFGLSPAQAVEALRQAALIRARSH